MNNNLYWNVYKSLEKEFVALADVIHIDDKQLDIYSMKIADLLIRTSVEIESISKELYFREGGTKNNDNDLYFDTDCLNLLESKWNLSKKVVMISSPILYFDKNDNIYLTPLHKAYKRGSSSSDWKKAYQAVKHNRVRSLSMGNIKHFIRSLAALFILNIYYQDQSYKLGTNSSGNMFDASIGSSVFSIQLHPFPGINASGIYKKNEDYDKCIYVIQATDETKAKAQDMIELINSKIMENAIAKINHENSCSKESFPIEKVIEDFKKYQTECIPSVVQENKTMLISTFSSIEYEVVLNKNQY